MHPVEEFRSLGQRWHKLSNRTRSAILVMAGIYRVPRDARPVRRTPTGEQPHWLPTALLILKDANAQISDRKLARRLGIAQSTLARNPTFQQARKSYAQSVRKVVGKRQKPLRTKG